MKTFTAIFLLVICSICHSQKGKDSLVSQGKTIPYEFENVPENSNSKYYVFYLENDPNATLESLGLAKCITPSSAYYLLNISKYNFTDEQKELLLVDFIKKITRRRELIGSDLNLILNENRTKTYLENLDGIYIKIPKNLTIDKKRIETVCKFVK